MLVNNKHAFAGFDKNVGIERLADYSVFGNLGLIRFGLALLLLLFTHRYDLAYRCDRLVRIIKGCGCISFYILQSRLLTCRLGYG